MRRVGIVLSLFVILFSIWFAAIGIPMDVFPEGNDGVIRTEYVTAPVALLAGLLSALFTYGLIKKNFLWTFISIFALLAFSFLYIFSIGFIYLPIATVMLILGVFAILPKGPPKIKKAKRIKKPNRPSESA